MTSEKDKRRYAATLYQMLGNRSLSYFIRSMEEFQKLVVCSKTKTGIKVVSELIDKEYEKGIRATKNDVKLCNITWDNDEPRWNYSISLSSV